MPRSEKLMGSQLYSSHLPSQMPSQKTKLSLQKKRHICNTCERSFTTSGHLARHSRVHTGERNHRCPFPGCETRCSRQDNLQQQSVSFSFIICLYTKCISTSYRIHLSPGSRRNAARTKAPRKRASPSASPANPESAASQNLQTPHIEEGRIIAHHFSPNSTPPLIQATLPSASTLPHPRISSSSSPSTSYSPNTHHILPAVSSSDLSLPVSSPLSYSHRSGTTYQSPVNPYSTFVNDTRVSQISSRNAVGTGNFTYSHSHSNYGDHSQQHSRSTSPSVAMPSRHSPSHISKPRYLLSHGPPSPISVSSHTSAHSGPPTPTHHFSYADTHTYSHPHNAMASNQPTVNNNQIHNQSHLFQDVYTPNVIAPRYLPPLTLAPIQDERYTRRLETPRYSQTHNSPYLHHTQPLAGFHHSIGLVGWKSEAMRKGAYVI
jgi:zinc finger protein CreA/MIG